jgi:hypothetical protein
MSVFVRRIAAVVFAVALVVFAVVVRAALDDGDQDGNDAGGGTNTLAVRCSSELADACLAAAREIDGVSVTVEPAGTTLDEAARAATTFDAWATLDPWAAAADAARALDQRDPVFATTSVIARTDLVLAVAPEREAALAAACEGLAVWRCVGDAAGRPWTELGGEPRWGTVALGIPDPTRSALGGVVLLDLVGGFLALEDFARNDWEANDDIRPWLARVKRSVPPVALDSTDPLDILLTRPTVNVAVSTAASRLAKDPDGSRSAALPTGAAVNAVLAAGAGAPAATVDAFGAALARHLTEAGWTAGDTGAAPSSDPEADGRGGTLLGLQELWRELR